MCQDGAKITKLLSAPSVLMILVAIVVLLIIALPALFRFSSKAEPKKEDENEDLGIQFVNSESETESAIAGKKSKRKSQLDPQHITRVARRNNRDG